MNHLDKKNDTGRKWKFLSTAAKDKNKLVMGGSVLIIMLAFLLLSFNTLTTWFRSDSEIYYMAIRRGVENLRNGEFSFSDLGIAGHMSYGYSIFVFLGQLLLPDQGMGIRLVNQLLAVITIGVFYRILCKVFPKMDQWVRLGFTAAFAFSPLLLGMIGEVHSDFPVLCFFTWLVYFYISKRQIACLLTGFLLCFSKETGVIYYCTFFAGCFLYRLVKNKNKNWFKKLFDEFSAYEWLLLVPADLFLVRAISSGGWGGKALTAKISAVSKVSGGRINSFYFSWHYIGLKLREIFLMNFAWLLVVPLILFLAALCRKKLLSLGSEREWLIGIGASMSAFLLFNISYFTYAHYRYVQLFLFFHVILAAFLLEKSCGGVLFKRGFAILLTAAFMVESFVTIDPVTFLTFRSIDVGNGKVVTANEFATNKDDVQFLEDKDVDLETGQFMDSGMYNREYIGFERALEEAFADIDYDLTKAIVFPAIYRNKIEYTLLGYIGAHDPWNLYWNSETGNIAYDVDQTWIQWLDISKGIPQNISSYREVWYMNLFYQGEWYKEKNLDQFKVLEERTYQSGKWKIKLERIEYKGH